MNKLASLTEKQRLDEIVQEYRAKDYQVTLAPPDTHLPGALAGFHPHLLAVSARESVVVEVTNRLGLVANGATRVALATVVDTLPGWRLELAIVAGEEAAPEPLKDARELPPEVIRRRIALARLLAKEHFEAAVLEAWSLAEAAMRVAAQTYHLPPLGESSLPIIKGLYIVGVIDQADFTWLQETLHGCNLLAHGYTWEKSEGNRVGRLLDFSEKMLGPDPAAA